jgi:anti-sigma-K factor RskA
MPATPVDDHTEEFEQLAGLSALDVLEGEERTRFEQHAAGCERCQVMVRLDREALARLSLAAPEMDPSPDFKARLMQRAALELAQPPTSAVAEPPPHPDPTEIRQPIPIRRPPNVIPLWRSSPWARAIAALLVVGLVTVGAYSYENQPIATYELNGSTSGTARVVVRRSGTAVLEMHGVADPGPGFLYEAWIIGPDGKPKPAATTVSGSATVPLTGDVRGTTVAITRELGRSDVPTPPILMKTEVTS